MPIREAAFTGLRVLRDRPTAALIWFAANVLWLVSGGLAFVAVWGQVPRLAASNRSWSGVLGFLIELATLALLCALFDAVMAAAMNRVVSNSEPDRFGYLRFGRDELRQWAVTLASWASLGGAGLAIALAASLTLGLLYRARLDPVAISSSVVGGCLVIAAVLSVTISIPFAMVSAITFDARRLAFREGFGVARRHFWRLLGVRGLTLIPVGVIYAAYGFGFFAIGAATGTNGDGPIPFFEWGVKAADMSVPAYLSGHRLEIFAARAALAALSWPLMTTPFAAIHRHLILRTVDGRRLEEVFG